MALINKLGLVALLSALPLIGYAQEAAPTDPQVRRDDNRRDLARLDAD